MPTLVKICGLSDSATLEAALNGGASHIGLVHYEPSPRHVALDQAASLRQQAGQRARVVLLLVSPQPALLARAYEAVLPDVIQFHGSETPDYLAKVRQHLPVEVWKAVGVRDAASLADAQRFRGAADRLLYDAPARALPGGTGTRFDWSLLAGHDAGMAWGLAGGLTPETVGEAIRETGAPLVDVSSGIESAPGIKDMDKIAAFLKAAAS